MRKLKHFEVFRSQGDRIRERGDSLGCITWTMIGTLELLKDAIRSIVRPAWVGGRPLLPVHGALTVVTIHFLESRRPVRRIRVFYAVLVLGGDDLSRNTDDGDVLWPGTMFCALPPPPRCVDHMRVFYGARKLYSLRTMLVEATQ